MTRLVVVSGLSGSGKSVALNMLEDLGWYCIDNIPAGLVQALVSHSLRTEEPIYRRLAVGLDARNRPDDLASIPALRRRPPPLGPALRGRSTCTPRTRCCCGAMPRPRRRHPLPAPASSLADAIAEERRLLHPLIDSADLVIDTSRMSVHELRDLDREARRAAGAGPAFDPVRVLRLQARDARRRGFRVRRAHAAESVLGAGAAAADGHATAA